MWISTAISRHSRKKKTHDCVRGIKFYRRTKNSRKSESFYPKNFLPNKLLNFIDNNSWFFFHMLACSLDERQWGCNFWWYFSTSVAMGGGWVQQHLHVFKNIGFLDKIVGLFTFIRQILIYLSTLSGIIRDHSKLTSGEWGISEIAMISD